MILFFDFTVRDGEISSVDLEETFFVEIDNLKLTFINVFNSIGEIKRKNLLVKLDISFLEFFDTILVDCEIADIIMGMVIEIGFSDLLGVKSSSGVLDIMGDVDHFLHQGWWEIGQVEVANDLFEHVVKVEFGLVVEHGLVLL